MRTGTLEDAAEAAAALAAHVNGGFGHGHRSNQNLLQ